MEWTFKLPPSLGGGDFVMRELDIDTLDQISDGIIMSAGRDEKKLIKASKEAQKEYYYRSVVSWRGERIESPEIWWRACNPKERLCVARAYTKIHTLDDEEEAYLLESLERAGKKDAVA